MVAKRAARALIAAMVAVAAISGPASAEPVFLDYSQAELDRNYDQAAWAPNIRQILARYDWRSEQTRSRIGEPERFSYGETEVEGFDLFRAESTGAPLQVFVHGGAWRAGSARSYHFPAEMFVDRGVSYAALDFGNVQDIGLDGMADQIRSAFAWIHDNADDLGIDRDRIHISGHSSGAHLAAVAMVTDWSQYGVPADILKGATLISGLYDLEAPRLSARSSYVPFTNEIEEALSPERQVERIAMPVVLAYGTLETDEFRRQTVDFSRAIDEAAGDASLIVAEGYNHFEIMDDFGNPYSVVSMATLAAIAAGR